MSSIVAELGLHVCLGCPLSSGNIAHTSSPHNCGWSPHPCLCSSARPIPPSSPSAFTSNNFASFTQSKHQPHLPINSHFCFLQKPFSPQLLGSSHPSPPTISPPEAYSPATAGNATHLHALHASSPFKDPDSPFKLARGFTCTFSCPV